jgi:hypothetical protein
MSARRAWTFPPARLRAIRADRLGWIRPLWFLALAFAIVLDIAGTVFVLRDSFHNDLVFARVGLVSQIENDGSITVESIASGHRPQAIPAGTRIVAIRGQPVSRDTAVWDLAKLLEARDGEVVPLRFALPHGASEELAVRASDDPIVQANSSIPVPRDVRIGARLVISLLTCLTLIACGVLLFIRRPQDPVGVMFSFSFLLFAACIDPPLTLWLAAGMGNLYDVYSCLAWVLLVIAIAAFPNGIFTPRPVRWVIVAAPLAAIPLAIDSISLLVDAAIAFIGPLLLLISHVIKYRRFRPGIERQQLKWAGFGFAAGLLLLTAAFVLTATMGSSTGQTSVYVGLSVLGLFNLGFLAMALGLLVSLLRFRLWEADRVISRSAISAAVTLMVGIVWTLSVDGVKLVAGWVFGAHNETIATLSGAFLAAAIFAPTQTLAMRWAKRRLEGDDKRIGQLIARLAAWRTTEAPEQIAIRTLSALSAAVHCSSAALLVDSARGLHLLASRDVDGADRMNEAGYDPSTDRRFVHSLPLEDDDGPMGLLLLGPRSDMNRYNTGQLHSLSDVCEPLAEALRAALKRAEQAETVQLTLSAVQERLAMLEQGGPKLSPT